MTIILIFICIILLAALVFACYKISQQRDTIEQMGADYVALDQGMEELGESMQADILDRDSTIATQKNTIEDLVHDRSILYGAAVRCHKNCLPQYHDVSAEEQEIYARLEYLQNA